MTEKSEDLGIDREVVRLRLTNQQQEPEPARPVSLPPELERARIKGPLGAGCVLMLDTEEGMREFDKAFTRLVK